MSCGAGLDSPVEQGSNSGGSEPERAAIISSSEREIFGMSKPKNGSVTGSSGMGTGEG